MIISAFFQGILGASSLVLGASLALVWLPNKTLSAAIMAFGSGTLLSATAFEITLQVYRHNGFIPLLIGFLMGGFLFTTLTKYVDEHGGFLRQPASRRRYLLEHCQQQASEIAKQLAKIEVMQNLKPHEREAIALVVEPVQMQPQEIICHEGEPGDYFYMILEGEAEIRKAGKLLTVLGRGEVFGEMSLLTGEPRSATVMARTEMKLYQLNQKSFEHLLNISPHLASALSRALARRLRLTSESQVVAEQNLERWRQQLMEEMELDILIEEKAKDFSGLVKRSAPMAILVGSLIDNIPEATVIGINTGTNQVGWSFLVAVFISNFPEALSSAAGMKQAGANRLQILALWIGVVILSGFFALAGYYLQNNIPQVLVSLTEAIAGGAILSMLASTMMPEAYDLGGELVVFCTIAGFLVSFILSSLDF